MRKTWLIFSQAVTVAVAVLFVVATLKPDWLQHRSASGLPTALTVNNAVQPVSLGTTPAPNSYAAAARRATPAVVSITASKAPTRNPHNSDPWFQFFFGDRARQLQEELQIGLGSGVIVSPDGYLLTNNHVIEGADEVEVQLTDGRRARAKIVGTDPETDVAVLRIALDKLPAIAFGNADALQVGDVVLAIGNPFGVGQTVTSGIVSALGRNQLGINTFENFIQTDAAINPGNSGGALVDGRAELIGINTAIYSETGGYQGIGFAVPSNLARKVVDDLMKFGEVRRGSIGYVRVEKVSPELAQEAGAPNTNGALVSRMMRDSEVYDAGLRPGDIIVAFNGQPVNDPSHFSRLVLDAKIGTTATVTVLRDGRKVEFKLPIVSTSSRTRR